MIQLPNSCSCSNLAVTPKNWNKSTVSIKRDWKITYRFYEPGVPVKQVAVRGMNKFHLLKERQQTTAALLNSELLALKSGYNPNKKKYIRENISDEVTGDDTLKLSLNYALSKVKIEKKTKECIKSSLNQFFKAASLLYYDTSPIKEIERRHVIAILEQCEKINERFTDNTFNRYRTDLKILFKELVKRQVIKSNPIDEFLEPRKTVKKIRQTLTLEQRIIVDKFLHENHYNFWRYVQIFYHSGARSSELLQVKKSDVDLKEQRFKVLIKKGRERWQAWKIIVDEALPLWEEIMKKAKDNDFIFSKYLQPGELSINPHQISRRWNTHIINSKNKEVKEAKIKVTFYPHKHLKSTAVSRELNHREAAKLNSHKNEAMVFNIYDTEREQREHNELKKLKTPYTG